MTNYVIENIRDTAEEIGKMIPKTLQSYSIPELISMCWQNSDDDDDDAKCFNKVLVDNISADNRVQAFLNLECIKLSAEDVHITVDFDKVELLEKTILDNNIQPNLSMLDSYKCGVVVTYNVGKDLYAITKHAHKDTDKYIMFGLDICKTKGNTKVFKNNGLVMLNRKSGKFYFSCADEADCTILLNGQRIPVIKVGEDTVQNCFIGSRSLMDYYRSNPLMDTRYVMIGNRLLALATLQECLLCYLELRDNIPEYKTTTTPSKNTSTEHKVSKPAPPDRTNALGIHNHFIDLSMPIVHRCNGRKPWQGGHHASPCQHTVREHLRHYKNGKVVVVKSFIRGKVKNTLELETYGI